MKFALLVLGLMLGGSPNRMFYVCDSLTSVYYTDKQYEHLKSAWQKLPDGKVGLLSYQNYLQIALANADTGIEATVSMLVERYGFDFRQYSGDAADSTKNIFFCRRYYAQWDSLLAVWQRNHSDMAAFRQEITHFKERERIVYPNYLRSATDTGLKASIDSLFESLLSLCVRQNALPNMEHNGYGMDISIPLFHILSISDSLLQERWAKIFPFIEKAFEAGEISNSYFFMYDRLLYRQCGRQYFGGMDREVPIIDGSDYTERQKRYLMDKAPLFIQINEQWKKFYDGETR